MAENNNHYKTRQVVAQALGNTGAQQLPGVIRSAADEGLKRMAAHEKATKRLSQLRRAAVADHNAAVAWQNQKLANIEKGYRPGLTRAARKVEAAREALERYHANVEEMGRRVARGNTNRAVREATGRINQLRGNVRRGVDLIKSNRRLRAATGGSTVFENQTLAEVKQAASQAKQVVQQRTDLIRARAAGGEAKDASAFMNRTLKSQRAQGLRADVFNAEQQLRQVNQAAQNSRRAAISHTRAYTQQVQQRFNAAAQKVVNQAGPKATFIQRALVRMSQLGQPITETAGKTAQTVMTGGGMFASRAEIAARLAAEGRTGKVLKTVGKLGEKAATGSFKAAARAAKAPVKAISGALNFVEKGGKIVAGTGRAGKIVTGLTNATGLAGGFATGAWIDAGLNYAQFKAEGHSFSDLGKTVDTFKVTGKDGKEHTVEIKNPTLGDVVFSRKYAGEAIRGTLRNLTFGVFGDKEYDWENGGPTPEEQSANLMQGLDPNTGKPLVATDGTDVSGIIADRNIKTNDVVKRNAAVASYFASFDPKKQVKAGDAQLGARLLGMAGNARSDAMGFISAVKHLGEMKDQKIEGIRQRLAAGDPAFDNELGRIMRSGVDRERASAILLDQAMKHETGVYEKRLGAMMKSDAAAKASDYNRRAAYLTITGRDYDVDTSATLDAEAKQDYADFNEIWSSMDAKDRVLFDREGFRKGHAERVSAAENAAEANAVVEEVANG